MKSVRQVKLADLGEIGESDTSSVDSSDVETVSASCGIFSNELLKTLLPLGDEHGIF